MSLNASFSESANPFGRGEVLIVFVNVEAKARSRGLRPCWEARRRKRYRRPGGDAEREAGEKNRGMETDLWTRRQGSKGPRYSGILGRLSSGRRSVVADRDFFKGNDTLFHGEACFRSWRSRLRRFSPNTRASTTR